MNNLRYARKVAIWETWLALGGRAEHNDDRERAPGPPATEHPKNLNLATPNQPEFPYARPLRALAMKRVATELHQTRE
jgi:hypothetical protein